MVCILEKQWYIYVGPSICVWLLGYICIFIRRFQKYCSDVPLERISDSTSFITEDVGGEPTELFKTCVGNREKRSSKLVLKDTIEGLVRGRTYPGKLVIGVVWLLNVLSLVLYFIDEASVLGDSKCVKLLPLDALLHCCFFIFSMLRFGVCKNGLMFWSSLSTFVDIFTIPQPFIAIYLGRNWLGLRFLRALNLIMVAEILQLLGWLRSRNSIRMTTLAMIFTGVWLSTSGFVHLVENTGDPFYEYNNGQSLTYWDSVYYMLVTMSTVGFGDISCVTVTGKIFITAFIIGSYVMFGNIISEVISSMATSSRRMYRNCDHIYTRKFVIVCGHITCHSVTSFLKDYLQRDTHIQGIRVIFVHKDPPGEELELVIKTNFTQVRYFQGSVLNDADLQAMHMSSADACLILSNKCTPEPYEEDVANIMRCTSVKTFRPNIRVIMQVLQYRNKQRLKNVPHWNPSRGDEVICVTELTLNLMGQHCISPCLPTLVANIIRPYSSVAKHKIYKLESWEKSYHEGLKMEVYNVALHKSFNGMPFSEATKICYCELDVLLIALYTPASQGEDPSDVCSTFLVNPSEDSVHSRSVGVCIASSAATAKQVSTWCTQCLHHHGDHDCFADQPTKSVSKKEYTLVYNILPQPPRHLNSTTSHLLPDQCRTESNGAVKNYEEAIWVSRPAPTLRDNIPLLTVETRKASICKRPQCKQSVTSPTTSRSYYWTRQHSVEDAILKHIIAIVIASGTDPIIQLENFVKPLRTIDKDYDDLRPIVLVGDRYYLEREWASLQHYPKIYIHESYPILPQVLEDVNIRQASSCVILSAARGSCSHPELRDKDVVMCALEVQALLRENLDCRMVNYAGASNPEYTVQSSDYNFSPTPTKTNLLVETANDSSVQYLGRESTLSIAIMDSLVVSTYYSPCVSMVVNTLSSGSSSDVASFTNQHKGEQASRNQVTTITLEDGEYSEYKNGYYGDLFSHALLTNGVLCLGVRRKCSQTFGQENRRVITNPQSSFRLNPSDSVYCLLPQENPMQDNGNITISEI